MTAVARQKLWSLLWGPGGASTAVGLWHVRVLLARLSLERICLKKQGVISNVYVQDRAQHFHAFCCDVLCAVSSSWHEMQLQFASSTSFGDCVSAPLSRWLVEAATCSGAWLGLSF